MILVRELLTHTMLFNIEKISQWLCDESIWGLCDSEMFEINDFYEGFKYKTNCPCFLDGFFEIFIYEKSDIYTHVSILLNKDSLEIKNTGTMITHTLEYLAQNILDLLLKVIKKDGKIKNNFINYIILVINSNKDRGKIVFDY